MTDVPTRIAGPLTERLFRAQVGGCTCLTKTPELRYHDAQCHYRLFSEASDEIGRLEQENQRLVARLSAAGLPGESVDIQTGNEQRGL